MPKSAPGNNSLVDFQISFESGEVPELSGTGVVRWVRHEGSVDRPAGFGLEFESLGDRVQKHVHAIVEAHKIAPFIPREPYPR